jgi:hypothetical protein
VVLHLTPSRNHVAGDPRKSGTPSSSFSRVDPQVDVRRESAAGVSSESEPEVALMHFSPLAVSYHSMGTGAWRGRWSPARPEARGGRCREVGKGKGTKERKRVVGKAAGASASLCL